jgi:uncharacterized protein (DUF1778 family)
MNIWYKLIDIPELFAYHNFICATVSHKHKKKEAIMAIPLPRITARMDADTQGLLTRAAALSGMPSMNAFVVNAAVEKARQIIAQDQVLRLSENDAEMLIKALNQPPVVNTKLQAAAARYESMNQS